MRREGRDYGKWGVVVIALAILATLVTGCGSSTAGQQSSVLPSTASTTAPVSVPDTGPPSLQFSWTAEPGIRLENASVPCACLLDDGRVRLYYGGDGGILSAISPDGITFTPEEGVRVPSGGEGSGEMIVSDPTLVKMEDGRVRMYYKGATGPGGPGESVHSIYSAVSADGLQFEKEGIRIDSQQTPDNGWASVPEAIVLPDGRVRLYYVSDGADVEHGIVSAISDDGLNFTREGPVLTGFVDPAVVRLADGSYMMLAVAFPVSEKGRLTDAASGIYSFLSEDSVGFQDRELVLAGESNIDPSIVDMGDGAYRIYYWNSEDDPSVIRSISGQISSVPESAVAAAPDITPVMAARSIAGINWWLFAVDDGDSRIALSGELDGNLLMGRLDVMDPDATVSWQTIAGPDDTGGIPIADHWHIFAHGYHWLVFSVAGDTASYLLKLDTDFQRMALVPVEHADGPTNDMFLVAEPDGVAVGHFNPGYGHTMHRFDIQGNPTGEARIGGGIYIHANGSSAILVEGGYLVFASSTLDPQVTGSISIIRFDDSWQPVSVEKVLDEEGTNAAMATAARLDRGYLIMHVRVRDAGLLVERDSPDSGSVLPDDSGSLVRLVIAPDGTIVSRETLVPDSANRPHTSLIGELLITTWDENGTVRRRVDRIR